MKQAALLLIISTVLAASGCAGRAPLTVRHEFSRCPRPQLPELPEVSAQEHICSPDNLERIMEIIFAQRWMIEQQDGALDCYEAQASGDAGGGK